MIIKELIEEISIYKKVFDLVRLVNPETKKTMEFMSNNEIKESKESCFDIWKRNEICANCISSYVYNLHKKNTKFEFIDNRVYIVTGRYIEIEDKKYILECIQIINENVLLGVNGQNRFIKEITEFNEKLYTDPLTNLKNRRYYYEQVASFKYQAVAYVDLDKFKLVNDNFGHDVGDIVLKEVAKIMTKCIRDSDVIIRMGGDEFLIIFKEISYSCLKKILEKVRKEIKSIKIEEASNIKLTTSIGGVYCNARIMVLTNYADKALYKAKENRDDIVILNI